MLDWRQMPNFLPKFTYIKKDARGVKSLPVCHSLLWDGGVTGQTGCRETLL